MIIALFEFCKLTECNKKSFNIKFDTRKKNSFNAAYNDKAKGKTEDKICANPTDCCKYFTFSNFFLLSKL